MIPLLSAFEPWRAEGHLGITRAGKGYIVAKAVLSSLGAQKGQFPPIENVLGDLLLQVPLCLRESSLPKDAISPLLKNSLVALYTALQPCFAKPFSLPTHRVAKINFPPFFAGKMCHGRKIYTTTNLGLSFGIHNVDCKTGGFLPKLIFLIVDAYIFYEAF